MSNAKSVNLVKQRVKVNLTMTKGTANNKVSTVINGIKGQVQILGCNELAVILDETTDKIAKLAKKSQPKRKELGVAIGPQAVQNVFQRVARELTGVEIPWITANPLIRGLQPIILEGHCFTINNYQMRYAIAMVTGGNGCTPTKAQRLVHEFCEDMFKLRVRRTTLAIMEPKLYGITDKSPHVWTYTANVNDIIDCPNR